MPKVTIKRGRHVSAKDAKGKRQRGGPGDVMDLSPAAIALLGDRVEPFKAKRGRPAAKLTVNPEMGDQSEDEQPEGGDGGEGNAE